MSQLYQSITHIDSDKHFGRQKRTLNNSTFGMYDFAINNKPHSAVLIRNIVVYTSESYIIVVTSYVTKMTEWSQLQEIKSE